MAVAWLAGISAAHGQADNPAPTPSTPGQSFKECRNCPDMIVLPPGTFTMGSPADEPLRRENEPQQVISIPRVFAVSKTAVTWDQWEACVRANWCDGIAVDAALRSRDNGEPNPDYRDSARRRRELVRRAGIRGLAERENRRGRRLSPAV
jgi:formylglycine-generating enzyme required for sulfatase activity